MGLLLILSGSRIERKLNYIYKQNQRGMMKKLMLLAISLIPLNCFLYFGVIKATKDDYRNVSILSLDLYTNTERTEKGGKTLFSTFSKTLNENSQEVAKCYFYSQFTELDQPLVDYIFIKTDDNKIKVKLTSTKILSNPNPNAHWANQSGEFIVSKELQKEIENSKTFSIRFYSGDFPYDANFSQGDLNLIKELLKRKP
ncbi:hypothetical protein EHO59_06190 [Leptospira semungkisensis]|uniref:Uncharacterized protein n=1 Tax=Leptospira semungkisensis TaxID=2484985 RepID=A0A4R9G9W1_9LEPT|nr:hypothetical protein [Leptospira semungkisensis]TGK07687.1 hypothetical protein EHO59_06190 [Leptospira semungkisensis]